VTRYRVRIRIMPRAGILDPQGQAVERALSSLGFGGVGAVRVGRNVEFSLESGTEAEAREEARLMCERLLANPVTEDYTLDAVDPAA
jgi:phosphoribosylformylglycinamidine synthase